MDKTHTIFPNFLFFFLFCCIINCSLLIAHCEAQPSITWQRLYDGPLGGNDYGHSICQSTDGYFYVTGQSAAKIYVLKLNSFGDTIWTNLVNTNAGQSGYSVVSTLDGGCILTGGGTPNSFLVKLNSSGIIDWIKTYGGADCFDLKKTFDGGYVACGRSGSQGYVLKVDSTGGLQWEKFFTSNYVRKEFRSVIDAYNTGYLVAGFDEQDSLKADVLRLNTSGEVIWEKYYKILNRACSGEFISKSGSTYVLAGGLSIRPAIPGKYFIQD